jgi:hypothetical protein
MRNTTVVAIAAAIMLSTTGMAQATLMGWWRFGDDDSGLTAPPVNGANIGPSNAAGDKTVNHSGTLDGMWFQSGNPKYSNVVPGAGVFSPPKIYDPITMSELPNAWSMHAPGLAGTERLRPGAIAVPSVFTLETFAQVFTNVDVAIVNHQNSSTDGWRLQRNSGGSVSAILVDSSTAVTTITSPLGVLPLGEWKHVAVVYQNLPDATTDFFLYVDYTLVASGSGTLAMSGSPTFHVGNATSGLNRQIRMDEVRYFDEVVGVSNFLQVVPEPSAFVLSGFAVIGLGSIAWRRRR